MLFIFPAGFNLQWRLSSVDMRKISEAVVQRCSVKKVSLKISQNSPENTFVSGLQLYIKKRLRHRCFPVNFAKCSRTPSVVAYETFLIKSTFSGFLTKFSLNLFYFEVVSSTKLIRLTVSFDNFLKVVTQD